jgi:predicted  nucleic acid-binding Zn-ribbon protein
MVFLERDIKARKHAFGIQMYDILSMNNASTSTSEIQKAFDECQRDITALEAKVNNKREEMEAIDGSGGHVNVGANVNSTEAEFGAVQSP